MRTVDSVACAVLFLHLGADLLPAQWGPLSTSVAPAPRSSPLLAFDLVGNRTLMFGGNYTNEFWSLSDGTWTRLTPAVLPGPRARASLAANLYTGEILLYGGESGSGSSALDETWLWNGANWQQLAPSNTPGGLSRHAMTFDVGRQVIVLYGGRDHNAPAGQALDGTWEFSQGNWTHCAPAQSPPLLVDVALSFHQGLNQVMLFGGQTAGATGAASDQTWVYDGTNWTQINTTGERPPARSGAQLVPVLGRNCCLLFGGRDPITQQIFNDTWEHDGTKWTKLDNVYGGIYPPRADVGLCHDLVRDRIVAFGGKTANNELRDDTWEYGAQWQRFGTGCAGSAGTPVLTGRAAARLGTTCTADISNVPAGIPFAFMAIGVSRTQWAGGSLPAQLTPFGMPNCRTYTSADLLAYAPATAGTATWSYQVPLVPGLVGTPFYLQGVTFDPGANVAGLAVSNAATLVIGY